MFIGGEKPNHILRYHLSKALIVFYYKEVESRINGKKGIVNWERRRGFFYSYKEKIPAFLVLGYWTI
jgi:hypothetical protein